MCRKCWVKRTFSYFRLLMKRDLGRRLSKRWQPECPSWRRMSQRAGNCSATASTGDLIPPADPDALANAMIDYLEKRPRVPVDAENYLEGFTPEAMMDRYLELARRPTDE